jgi:hypothetical protein
VCASCEVPSGMCEYRGRSQHGEHSH